MSSGSSDADPSPQGGSRFWIACLALVAFTVVAYAPVVDNGFVSYDDPYYLTSRPIAQKGLTWAGLRWAITDVSFNWLPLTRLSYMLDCELFGLDPAGHHVTSLILHLASSVLLLVALWRMTGALGRSWTVAALFAVHPTHVESVAWIAERKDVLSTFFWMLALVAYASYASRPSRWRMAVVAVAIGLGLSAKQMLVTAPFALLLLDIWPLSRLRVWDGSAAFVGDLRARAVEKLPLFLLVAGGVWVALLGQQGNMMLMAELSLAQRAGNALIAYLGYIGKLLAPHDLAVLYPLPETAPVGTVLVSFAVLIGVTAAAVAAARRLPFFIVGWCWFLGTLLPVIGLVQIGIQAMADRYTYVSSIGLFIALVWGVGTALGNRGRRWIVVATLALLVVLTSLTRDQVRVWRDSVSLFEHAVQVAPSKVAHFSLADALNRRGDRTGAERHFRAAIELDPAWCVPYIGLANARTEWGRPDLALEPAKRAVQLCPKHVVARCTLAMLLDDVGQREEAIAELETAVELDPGMVRAHWGLCELLARAGRLEQAREHCRAVVAVDPGNRQVGALLDSIEARLAPPPEDGE